MTTEYVTWKAPAAHEGYSILYAGPDRAAADAACEAALADGAWAWVQTLNFEALATREEVPT